MESVGFEPTIRFLGIYSLSRRAPSASRSTLQIGGSGEIRTHGPSRIVCFQDRCIKPGSATLPYMVPPERFELSVLLLLRETALPICPRGYGMVRLAGLEPTRTRRGILSPLRLPITPQSRLYLVPQERFELSKAWFLRPLGVPVSTSHRGNKLFGTASWNRTKFPGSSDRC